MKILKKILKGLLVIILIPIIYLLVSLGLTYISVNENSDSENKNKTIYLNTNGIHLDLIINKNDMNIALLEGLEYGDQDLYFSFGWGDRNFYLNTPTWSDLTFVDAFQALLLNSETLMHLTRYKHLQKDWVEIKVDDIQLEKINNYLNKTFNFNSENNKIILKGKGYYYSDDFYEASGSYSCFMTCNSWVNTGLKEAEIEACAWTPFDFGLLDLHEKEGD